MREIKFRAWDKRDKRWKKALRLSFFGELYDCGGVHIHGNRANSFILNQYTGVKDKNGKEIFEGDVVRINTSEEEVVNVEDMCEFYANYISDLSFPEEAFEVIGNIHENPEPINT
jgi:uncharacterized phage protein (TIGR01671 family)